MGEITKLDINRVFAGIYENEIYFSFPIRYPFNKRLRMALNATSIKDKRILDAGFGFGVLLSILSRYTDHAQGLEISKKQVERTRGLFRECGIKNVKLDCGDVRKMRFKDDSFDVVFCTDMLEHIRDPEVALKEIGRVLKPGGSLIVSVPTENLLYKLGRLLGRFDKSTRHYHDSGYIHDRIKELFMVKEVKTIYPVINLFKIIICQKG